MRAYGVYLACALLLLPINLSAQGLRVAPLRIEMGAQRIDAALELSNLSNQPMNVQVSAVSWQQQNNRDVYTPTRDLYFSPPIATVPAAGKQVVRLRLKAKVDPSQEKTYRIYLQELPDPTVVSGSTSDFRLRLGIPVFVAPAKGADVVFEVDVERQGDGSNALVSLSNQGDKHLRVPKIEAFPIEHLNKDRYAGKPLSSSSQSLNNGIYALPGSTLQWRLGGLPLGPLALRLQTDFHNFNPDLPVSRRGELWLAVEQNRQRLKISGQAAAQ